MANNSFEIENELNSQVPRRVRSRWKRPENVASVGCLTLFLLPFIGFGIAAFVGAVSATIKVVIGSGDYFGLLFVWFFALGWNGALTSIGIGFWRHWQRSKQLVTYGIPTRATIVGKITEPSGDSNCYIIEYEFLLSQNHLKPPMRGRDIVTYAHYNSVNVGDVLTVLYLEDKPELSELYCFSSILAVPDAASLLRSSQRGGSTDSELLLHPAQSAGVTKPEQLVKPVEPPLSPEV